MTTTNNYIIRTGVNTTTANIWFVCAWLLACEVWKVDFYTKAIPVFVIVTWSVMDVLWETVTRRAK